MTPIPPERSRVAHETQLAADILEGTSEPSPMLSFDFSGRRHKSSMAPLAFEEGATIKESIVRWLEQQL